MVCRLRFSVQNFLTWHHGQKKEFITQCYIINGWLVFRELYFQNKGRIQNIPGIYLSSVRRTGRNWQTIWLKKESKLPFIIRLHYRTCQPTITSGISQPISL